MVPVGIPQERVAYQGSYRGCGNVSCGPFFGYSFAYLKFGGVRYLVFTFWHDFYLC